LTYTLSPIFTAFQKVAIADGANKKQKTKKKKKQVLGLSLLIPDVDQ
jgi:hypothetical protein